MRRHALVVAVSFAVLTGLAVPAAAAGTISGSVIRLSDGDPVAGASITAAGPGQTPVATTTGPGGGFSIDVAGSGPFGVGVQAPGLAGQAVAGVGADESLPAFELAPATFDPLPIDVGPSSAIRADATSGIFYSLAMGAPELYRTVDYGGTWQPVTAGYDDAETGLDNDGSELLAVSSVSGEVAVASTGRGISYSTDYGTTWRRVESNIPDPPTPTDPHFFWGHAAPGAPSTLLAAKPNDDGSWSVWRADMSAAQPTWVKEPSDPFGTGSRIAQADSRTGSFIGRVSADGELSFAPLTPSGPFDFGPVEASGLPSPPRLLQLGGAKEEAAPPDGALAVGGGTPAAVMLTKAAGASRFDGGSASAATTVPDQCLISPGTVGAQSSVAPTTTGTTGAGSLERCWLKKDGGALTFPAGDGGGVSNRAYDAGWGQDNSVAFISKFTFGGANMGPLKYGRVNADGAPRVEIELGSGGTDAESGGLTVEGMTSAPVSDTAYGPAGFNQQAVALKTDSIASVDGGQTMTAILPRGSEWSDSVAWWQGASGEWLLFGHAAKGCDDANDNNMLSALLNWDGASTLGVPNVEGSTCVELDGPTGAELSGGPAYNVTSLEPIPGTDTVFLGLGKLDYTGEHHLYRATLVPGSPPTLTDLASLDALGGVTLSNAPAAMAYCPSIAGESDVLLVALGTLYEHGPDVPGGLLRITGATGGSPSASLVDSIPHEGLQGGIGDVRADCGSGVVYAGGYDGLNGMHPGADSQTAFFKSVDGGKTFERITIPDPTMPEIGEITAIGLNPANPNDVKVAADAGKIAHSADGGSTWTLVNDPEVSRSNRVNDIEYPPAGGAGAAAAALPSLARVAALGVSSPLVGTSGGAFVGDVTAREGIVAVRTDRRARSALGTRITTLASDEAPTALLPAANREGAAVFARPNGLAYSFVESGTWSSPTPVPGTNGRDRFPAATVDGRGALHVAFARKGKRRGIYLTKLGKDGAWSKPRRLSRAAGDTLPSIAALGRRAHVVFLRARGRGRGLWHVASRGKGRAKAVPVPGSAKVRGAPSLAAGKGAVHLAYARAGRGAGICYASMRRSRWSRSSRLTKSKRDSAPSLATNSKGAAHIVFRGSRGLFALQRARKGWARRRVPGSGRRDADPALASSGRALLLASSRRAGNAPGIRYMRSTAKGRWRGRPRRISSSSADRNASVRAGLAGVVTLVFERR